MKASPLAALIFCAVVFSAPAARSQPVQGAAKPTIDLETLAKTDIIGRLGVPLGKVVIADATVVSGKELRLKAVSGDYLLKITAVDGASLETQPVMRFLVRGAIGLDLPRDAFELYRLKNRREAKGGLNEEQIRDLEQGYVGQKLKLYVYEVGGFDGIPKLPPPLKPNWQDHDFGFSTSLIVFRKSE